MRLLTWSLVALSATCLAQSAEQLAASSWRGTVTATGHMTERNFPVPIPGTEIQFNASLNVTLELERTRDEPPLWSGKIVSSTLSGSYKETITDGTCVITYDGEAHSLDQATEPSTLAFNGNRGFTIFIGSPGATTVFTKTTTCNGMSFGPPETTHATLNIPQSTQVVPFPAAGVALTGETTVTQSVSSALAGRRDAPWDLEIRLSPETDLQLVVEESVAYQRWRPSVSASGAAGTPLTLTANLISKSGKPVTDAIKTITWELVGTSQEPGLALNFPVGAKGVDDHFDLELSSEGSDFQLQNKNQLLIRNKTTPTRTDTISIVPHDWGGWSEVQLSAVLESGIELKGRLRTTNEERIRLPKRQPNSKIADRWKELSGVSDEDASDAETAPEGDGHPGDGLTLYEEYRGFFERGEHTEGSPVFKDLFVRNRAMFATLGGIALFARETGVEVHYRLTDSEFPTNRVINSNFGAGPHSVDQHLVVMSVEKGLVKKAYASDFGPPKRVDHISIMSTWARYSSSVMANVTAHELGHAVAVRHHGEGDPGDVVWSVSGGTLIETRANGASMPIITFDGEFSDVTHYTILMLNEADPTRPTREFYVGARGGQHSGSTRCFMRYAAANKLIPEGVPNGRRYATEPQPVGFQLCDSRDGDGINPVEFGDGQAGCAHQLLVNDLYAP